MGGAEKVAYNLYKYSDKTKYEITYLVNDEVGEFIDVLKDESVRIISIKKPSPSKLSNYYNGLYKIMRDAGPFDVVHAHNFTNNGFILAAAKKAGVPIRISHSHTNYKTEKKFFRSAYSYLMRKLIIRYSNYYVACSIQAGESLYGAKFFESQGIILRNSIDVAEYTFNKSIRRSARNMLNLSNDELAIVQVGRLSKEKNQRLSLDILHELIKTQFNTRLFLVGDGPDRLMLEKYSTEFGLQDKVTFLGNRSDVACLLQAADMYIMPSTYEGVPLALVEAQSISLTCIISENISNEAILGGKTYKVSLNSDARIWAKKILTNIHSSRTSPAEHIITGYDVRRNINEFTKKYYAV